MLYKNLHKIKPESLISITYKLHGTSGISSYVLCKKPLKWYEKALKKLKVNIVDTTYDFIYSSRKVIKNEELNKGGLHYYNEDIWGIAHNELKDFLLKGMTFYYEIVGFTPTGTAIQKDYDYGCNEKEHKIFIYRITQTNVDGKVFEFSAKQVQDFCKKNSLNPVPELYYGYAENFYDYNSLEEFLEIIKERYNDHNCFMCKNSVPEEGIVVRIEGNDLEVYKQKSNRFYELETKELDKGIVNIEDNQDEG